MPTTEPDPAQTMRCMEIRGGSHAVEEHLHAPGLDGWVFSRPYQAAAGGGDVHYLSLCGGGIVSRLILADVAGHGESAAEVGRALRQLLRQNINTKDQTRLVADLNRQFAAVAQLDLFATAVVATYLATDRSLTVCNAAHPRPLRWLAREGRWEFLGPETVADGNLPWGLDDATAYHQFRIPLEVDDAVVFYTDALVEATDPSGRPLGEAGLLELIQGLGVPSARSLGPALIAAITAYRAGRDAEDDVTLVVWHHNAQGPRPPHLIEKLDVYARVFGLKEI